MEKKNSWEASSYWYFVLTSCLFLSILPRHIPKRIQHFGIWTTLAQYCIRIDYNFFSLFSSRSGSRPPYCWGSEITLSRTLDEWSSRCGQIYLTNINTHKTDIYCARRDSNQQSKQDSGRRPTSQIARPLKSADYKITDFVFSQRVFVAA